MPLPETEELTDQEQAIRRECPECGFVWFGGKKTRCQDEVFHGSPGVLRLAQAKRAETAAYNAYVHQSGETGANPTPAAKRKVEDARDLWYARLQDLRAAGGTAERVRAMLIARVEHRQGKIRRRANRG